MINPPRMSKMRFREESDPLGEMNEANYVIVPCTDKHPAGQYCPGWTWVRRDHLEPHPMHPSGVTGRSNAR